MPSSRAYLKKQKETTQTFKSFLSGAVGAKVVTRDNRENQPPRKVREPPKDFIAFNKEKVAELSRRKSQDREIKEVLCDNSAKG
jgi:hypothetical protein